jgi:hypothetical protein
MNGTKAKPSSSSISIVTKEKPRMIRFTNTQRSRRGRVMAAVLISVAMLLGLSAQALAAPEDFGIEAVSASLSTLEAGRHPDITTEITFNTTAPPHPQAERVSVELPPGLTANPQLPKGCSVASFVNPLAESCPQDAQVGIVEVELDGFVPVQEPLYNLEASEDEVAHLGFIALLSPYIFTVDLRSGSDYGVTVSAENAPSFLPVKRIRTTVWGVPADPVHDGKRLSAKEAFFCTEFFGINDGTPCFTPTGSRESGLVPEPFTSNPASCGPMPFRFEARAYALPGQVFEKQASAGDIVDCDRVPFHPSLALSTTSRRAGDATGLEATLELPVNNGVSTVSESPLRSARVVLPEGMTVNSSAADGLQACSAEQAGYKTDGLSQCPEASKLGAAEITSPALKRPIQGGLFLRSPEAGHLFRFWLVSNEFGVNLKLPAEVELDQQTGRLTTVIEESPQLPTEKVVLRLRGGGRAPLRNPESCGSFAASYEFGPWSGNPAARGVVPMPIDQGCNVGGFDPKLSAGTISPSAGEFSPFVFDITREDGEQNLAAIDVTLPPGLTAKLAGVPLCSDGSAASGSCPAASQIGAVRAAVGAGSQPLWIPQPGKSPTAVYLAGPYKGAPYSAVATVPAQAGPFDLGLVTVRSGIYVDPESAQVTIKSDPLPQLLQGIPTDYRHVGVEVNRSNFTLNPTSCAVQSVRSGILGSGGAVAHPSDRFQAADCASLGFTPRLGLRLKGGTKRGAHPRLHAVLASKSGQANIRRAVVALPHSEFLDQAHIGTICTRVQFAANACPAASVYGHARAVTPLLDQPLEGPVYLRSSSHKLPDLVVDLRGQIDVVLAGRIDSINGGIRTTFESVPDAPVSRFELNLLGGKRGLLVNSTDLCAAKHRATVNMTAQNGRQLNSRPVLNAGCGKRSR